MSAIDLAHNIANALLLTSFWEGEQNYYPESIFGAIADMLIFGLSVIRKGQLGFLGHMFEVLADDWVITEWWIIDKTHHYQITFNRFDEDDWVPHMMEKTWVNKSNFITAFDNATCLIEKGIFEGKLPRNDKP
jgi:hypothetical protein